MNENGFLCWGKEHFFLFIEFETNVVLLTK